MAFISYFSVILSIFLLSRVSLCQQHEGHTLEYMVRGLVACCVALVTTPMRYLVRHARVQLPMRDGILLHTFVDFPDDSPTKRPATYDRSPYGTDTRAS